MYTENLVTTGADFTNFKEIFQVIESSYKCI